ncbi:hypothetical protein [Actinopolyspora halophila]|nr:hypothetical protein [Actinopolyspora halophila]
MRTSHRDLAAYPTRMIHTIAPARRAGTALRETAARGGTGSTTERNR